MADVFVSYASADRPRVQPLVESLRQQGWSVWWDRAILPGKTWDQVLEETLAEARCVIVLWSRHSVESDWVHIEADEAKRRGILVPALLDDVPIPLAFRRIQTADLVDRTDALPHAGFDELIRAVSEVLSSSRPVESTHSPGGPVKAAMVAAPVDSNISGRLRDTDVKSLGTPAGDPPRDTE